MLTLKQILANQEKEIKQYYTGILNPESIRKTTNWWNKKLVDIITQVLDEIDLGKEEGLKEEIRMGYRIAKTKLKELKTTFLEN